MRRIKKIGSGAYGSVYLAEESDDEGYVAIKRNFKDSSASWIGNLRELNILTTLKGHPFIVDLLNISIGDPFKNVPFTPLNRKNKDFDPELVENDKIHFVMEYISYVGNKFFRDKSLCTAKIGKKLTCQLLLAVEYMHGYEITHRDLKPSNLLIDCTDDSYTLKICDFGMGQCLCDRCPSTPGIATSLYRSWEVCCDNPNYGQTSDLWSVGCVVFEIFGKKSFINNTEDRSVSVLNRIIEKYPTVPSEKLVKKCKKYNRKMKTKSYDEIKKIERKTFVEQMKLTNETSEYFQKKKNGFDTLEDFLRKLLELDFNKRLTATEALEHPFLKDYSNYIAEIRKDYQPIMPHLPRIKIRKCKEREYAVHLAFNIYNNMEEISWYTDRILFHAIDLFDRYLEFQDKKEKKEDVELKFYVCLYMFYKIFDSMEIIMTWKEFTGEKYINKSKEGEEFESFLLISVVEYKLYRDTLYEISDTKIEVFDLLLEYGSNKLNFEGGSVRKLYRQILEKINEN